MTASLVGRNAGNRSVSPPVGVFSVCWFEKVFVDGAKSIDASETLSPP